MIPDETSHLRKLERDLYTTDIQPPNKRSVLHDKRFETPEDWTSANKKMSGPMVDQKIKTTKLFKNIFLVSLGFLLVALVVFGGSLLFGNNGISSKNVDVTITAKSFVDGGEALPIDVSIVNKNKLPMELATLVLEYPNNNINNSDAVTRISRDIGTVAVGDTHSESFNVQLYGTEGSQKQITATVQFRISGSNVIYDSANSSVVTIRTSPVHLTLDAADKAIPNQEIPFTFSIAGNGTATLPNTALTVQYPSGFGFIRAEPAPTSGNNVWYLGDLPPGVNRKIVVYGSLSGTNATMITMNASVGSQDTRDENKLDQVYNTISKTIALSGAFLDTHFIAAGNTDSSMSINVGDTVSVDVPWQNMLTTSLSDVEVTIGLSGSGYDPANVQATNGFFKSSENKIIWTKHEESNFASVGAGQSGRLSFSVKPKQSLNTTSVINPKIVMTISVKALSSGQILNAANIDTKSLLINSDFNVIASTLHYSGGITNTGPMPPLPNKETTYTLVWQAVNTRNKVSGVTVATTLPLWVTWKGVVVPQSETDNISYNSVTRELIWNAGDIVPAAAGGNTGKTIAMKIGLVPSTDQNGSIPNLTQDVVITGQDDFTGANLQSTKRPMNTRLLNDTSDVGAQGTIGGAH